MRWNFDEWGASIVLTGHEHTYERLMKGDNGTFPYVVNGLGGHPWIYDINAPDCTPAQGSVVRYNDAHGLMLAFGTSKQLQFCFYSVDNNKVDEFSISA